MRNFMKKIKVRSSLTDIAKRRIGQSRKKGAILIEVLAAIPIFVFLIWAIMNLMMYLLAHSQLNEAAYEAARAIAVEMRGHEVTNDVTEYVTNANENIELIVQGNNFIEIFEPEHMPETAYNFEGCKALYEANKPNVIRAYAESYQGGSGKGHYQVVVNLRSDFNIVGSWLPSLQHYIKLNARSVAQVELPGRYIYRDY